MTRSEILDTFYDIKANWKSVKQKGDFLPVDYAENGCSEEQFENASRRFAPGLRMEDIVLLFDTSVSNSGKTGIIFTTAGFYSSELNFLNKIARRPQIQMPVLYEQLERIDWDGSGSEFFLCFRDGTRLSASGSNNTRFVVMMLRGIIARGAGASAERGSDDVSYEYRTGSSLEDAPEALVKISESSERLAETVIGAMQDRISEKEKQRSGKKGGIFTGLNDRMEEAEQGAWKRYSAALSRDRRKTALRVFLYAEMLLILITLAVSKDPAGLFSDVFSCSMIGSITDIVLSTARRDFGSFIGYGNFMMAGLSCILLSVLDLELEDLKIRRGGYFLHTLLFTYTSGLMLVYVWNWMKAAFSSLVTVSLLKVPVSLIALLVSAILIFLALKELAGNIKETLISIVVGVFFMIGAWTVIYVLSAPLLALMAYLTKTVNPGLVSSLASSMERMIESLSHPDIYDRTVCTNIRLTVLFGYAVTCAFRKAWNDVKEKRQKQPGA